MNDSTSSPSGRVVVVASLWVAFFTLAFYTLPTAGGSVPRGSFWPLVPFQLLDLVDPPPPEPGDPPSGWQYLPQRLDLYATATLILFGSRCLGSLLLRTPALPTFDRGVDREVFAWGLGLSVWSLLVLLLGLVGLLNTALFAGALGVAVVAELAVVVRGGRQTEPAAEPLRPPWWFLAAAVPFVVVFLLGAALPPTEYDAKGYHLLGPKEFYSAGRIGFLPHNVYTSFPFLTEMLTLSGMVVRGDWYRGALVGKVVLSAFGPLTAAAVFATARSRFGSRAGWLAALISLTTPWTYVLSTTAFVEGALTFYTVLALLGVLRTVDAAREDRPALREALLAGLVAGSAFACKYPGLLTVVLPAGLAVAAVVASKRPRTDALRHLAAFAVGVALTAGPWLLKNVVETGNPVYPLASSVFGGRDLAADDVVRWNEAHSPDGYTWGGLLSSVVRVTTTSDRLSPLLYALAPLTLLLTVVGGLDPGWRRSILAVWSYVGFAFLVWWAATHRIDRFWLPMLPVVAVLAGAGGEAFRTPRSRTVLGVLVGGVVGFQLAYCTTFVTSGFSGYDAYLVESNAARDRVEQTTAPAVFDANQTLPDDAVVLCVGEAQVFDARFQPVYNTVFDRSIFVAWFAEPDPSRPPGEWSLQPTETIRATLAERGVTHVLVNWSEIVRYLAPGSYGFSEFVTPERFNELVAAGLLEPLDASGPRLLNGSERSVVADWDDFVVEQRTVEGPRPALRHGWQIFEVR